MGGRETNKPKTEMKQSIRKVAAVLALLLSVVICVNLTTGCGKSTLQTGGAYAKTNTVPDLQFYQADCTFNATYSALDAVFTFERDNRAVLWKLDPNIKKTLDKIRPTAAQVVKEYGVARKAYKANPVPAQLGGVMTALAKIQQLLATAQAVVVSVTATPAWK